MRVLIDSSIWVDHLRGRVQVSERIGVLLAEGRAALCPVVWVELWRGARGRAEAEALRRLRTLCLMLEHDEESWEITARLARKASQAGLNCPFSDLLIVACARRHRADLWHQDKHMDLLAQL